MAFTFSDDKFIITLFPLYIISCFSFSRCSLFLAFSSLTMMCLSVCSLYLTCSSLNFLDSYIHVFSLSLESFHLSFLQIFFSAPFFLTSLSGADITYLLEYITLTHRSLKLLIFSVFFSLFFRHHDFLFNSLILCCHLQSALKSSWWIFHLHYCTLFLFFVLACFHFSIMIPYLLNVMYFTLVI